MRRLIITADDFGAAIEVNEAVEQAYRGGVLRTASLMVAAPACDDAVARAPVETHGDGGYALGRILDQRNLAALGSDQACGCNSKPLIGIQPPIIVERPELESVLGQFLHSPRRPPR